MSSLSFNLSRFISFYWKDFVGDIAFLTHSAQIARGRKVVFCWQVKCWVLQSFSNRYFILKLSQMTAAILISDLHFLSAQSFLMSFSSVFSFTAQPLWFILTSLTNIISVKKARKNPHCAHENQGPVNGRNVSLFESDKGEKVNQCHCTNIGRNEYNNWHYLKKRTHTENTEQHTQNRLAKETVTSPATFTEQVSRSTIWARLHQ